MAFDDIEKKAKGIIDSEGRYMADLTREQVKALDTPRTALLSFCHLLNVRQRYFGQVGEFLSVQDMNGLDVVDQLDEHLLSHLKEVLEQYRRQSQKAARPEVYQFLYDRIALKMKELPQYPVAYMILFIVRAFFDSFEEVLNQRPGFDEEELEEALITILDSCIDRYLKTRHTPVLRHFSDVAREYSAVSRLKCSCGVEKYEVKKQALLTDRHGNPVDRLDIRCGDCGNERSIQFPLPNFKDIAVT